MTTTPQRSGPFPAPSTQPHRRHNLLIVGAAAVIVVGGAAAVMASRTQHSTDSFAGVSSVVVEVENGNLAISPAGDDTVTIRTTLNVFLGRLPVADRRLEKGVLTITSTCPVASMNCYVEDELTVPNGVPVQVRTTTGNVEATDIDVPEFDVETVTGQVSASFVRPPGRIAISVVTGTVKVTVPAVDYRFDARTTTGTINSDVWNNPTAPRTLQLSTVTGTITATAR